MSWENHTDTFQPSDNGTGPDGKEMFGFVAGLFYLAIMALSAPWAMLARKSGTLGTRAYWFDVGWANLLLLALRQQFPYSPCDELFTGLFCLMPIMLLWHVAATSRRKEHVHTQCVGTPWLFNEHIEWLVGLAVAAAFMWGYPPAAPFGIFIGISASALLIRSWSIEERDRQRTLQMEDALWEQNQMMELYERYKKG